jgi:hypothetical protein
LLDNTVSPELLEPALPGAWIAEHHRIWQMNFLNAHDLARFCHDRGLSSFREEGITQLWQLGLLKADLVESDEAFTHDGLADLGMNQYGHHVYSDERQLHQHSEGWGDALKTLIPLRDDVKLLFHPFRYYVLYHLDRALGLNSSRMQMLYQEGYQRILDYGLYMFNNWSRSEQYISSIKLWNDTASLTIITEPCIYVRIFHSIRYNPFDVENYQAGAEEISRHIDEYWNRVNELYHQIGMERLEELRQELCIATQMLDSNRWIHTLLCLGDSKLRLELEGHLGGALILRTMAEMLRRATEETFNTELREEDELGFGWVPKDVKEKIYGSNRLLDDHRAAGTFARRHGLNYKPRVHLYGEGNTEYGAFMSFFKSIGVPVSVNNLHGLIKEGKSMVTSFRDNLRTDIQEQMYSMVIIDGDRRENVRILESAARNNSTTEDDGLFGRYFLSFPDFEFANFEVEELEEVLWKWVGGEDPSQAERELLHRHVKDTKNSTQFFNGVKRATQSLLQLIGYDKCEEWGEELIKFAWEHQFKQNQKRQIVKIVEQALFWEKTQKLDYETAKRTYMVDPRTGELIKRTKADTGVAGF